MSDLGTLLDYIGQQNQLSGIQDAAKQFGESGMLDQKTSQLIQDNPRLGTELIPQLMQQKVQLSALDQAMGGGSQSQPQSSSALQQYASSGDSSPDASVPQTLPAQQAQIPSSAPIGQSQSSQPSAIQQLHQAFILGHGNIDQGMKIMQAQKSLAIPAGAAAPPAGYEYANGSLQKVAGGPPSPGQEDVDKNFADSWQTYNNEGGAKATQNALNTVQGTIDKLKSGQIKTGGWGGTLGGTNAEGDPDMIAKILNKDVLVARNNVASAVLPLAKPLFGSRVTNFDAHSLMNTMGIDPLADNDTNVTKLEKLKSQMQQGQSDIQNSGSYFTKNGTLGGYQNPSPASSSSETSQPSSKQSSAPAQNPALLATLKARGLLK